MNNEDIINQLNEINNQYILSIEVLSNGKYGQPFVVACVLFDSLGKEEKRLLYRCPIEEDIKDNIKTTYRRKILYRC